MKNRICAIPADASAIPPNPNKPAMIAITRNTTAQYSIGTLRFRLPPGGEGSQWENRKMAALFPAAARTARRL
jgi:hypothetical protein